MPPASVPPAPEPVHRWFLACAATTAASLAVTVGALAVGVGWWRGPFVLAHAAALLALIPLAIAVLTVAWRRERQQTAGNRAALRALLRRHRQEAALAAMALGTAAVSLSQFPEGVRALRATANGFTIGLMFLLVLRYGRARRRWRAAS